METKELLYDLPEELIAQKPLERRSDSRLLVLYRRTGAIAHSRFEDLPRFLSAGDPVVTNNTRVMPARLLGSKIPTGGRVEILLLRKEGERKWMALAHPGRRLHAGSQVRVHADGRAEITLTILEKAPNGEVVLDAPAGIQDSDLFDAGHLPMPPYVKEEIPNPERYQTIFAKSDGSVAAPTASLHFDEEVLKTLSSNGVQIAEITLTLGPTSFQPVKTKDVEAHRLQEEYCEVTVQAADQINGTRNRGARVIAVGTTVARTLESRALNGMIQAGSATTGLFITPGYTFQALDALVTNFHMPASTHLALVAAFAGLDQTKAAYRQAVAERYRFLSFGDAMLIL
ncbi:MAG: tRNA preQ1(34) S-adenosylmethionine ribosyltransferase-isomerase QueA [bacterium]